MKGVLNSIAVRIGLLFLAGLVVMQIAVTVAVLWPEERPAIFRLVSPRDAAAMARALESAPPEQQRLIVRALNAGNLIVQLEAGFPPDDGEPPRKARWARGLGAYERYGHELEGRAFRVQVRNGAALGAAAHGRIGAPGAVRLLVELKTGQVLVVERAPVLLQRLFARSAVIAAAAGGVLLLVMAACMVQIALPARRLARAARDLASDIDMPDLPEGGADEVRTLSAAFNGMKRRIRGLLDERTRVLAAIAHDMRTYLTRLRLRADFIEDAGQREAAVRDLEDMSLLLDDTLTFASEAARAGGAGPQTVDVARELADFVAVRGQMGEPVSLEAVGAAPLAARCAPLALRRMLANLTDNAVRYGGLARLSAGADAEGAWVRVEDDGPGVPAEALARVQEPFERLEPSRGRETGGAGLGLAIVKALARSQGGDLIVENRPEGGLSATVRLPAAGHGA